MSRIFGRTFLKIVPQSLANQVAYPNVFVQNGIDVFVEIFLHAGIVETRWLFDVDYFLRSREGLTKVLLDVPLGVLEEEDAGERVFTVVLFSDGAH